MKRSIKSLIGYSLKETDGEIGEVEEFYFDDDSWTIRYLIVKTGNWFSGHKVLISPQALQQPDWENKEFLVNLTKEQIQNSPDIDTDKPVSRQQEERLYSYYPWQGYWGSEPYEHGAGIFGLMPSELVDSENVENSNLENINADVANEKNNDPHLRSTKQVKGYNIHATDGEIGKVVDYIFDDTNWKINFLVVDSGTWLNSKKVLLSTQWIKEINWDNSIVTVNTSTEVVKNSPEFDDSQPLNETDERNLYAYYGRFQNENIK